MKKIDISTKKHPNTFALVDDEDYDRLNAYKWYPAEQKTGVLYVQRIPWKKGGKGRKPVFMHREVLGTPEGCFTDHRNHNGLNNQRYNLRQCTTSQNGGNNRKQRNKTLSKYKGVSKYSSVVRKKNWYATVKKEGKPYYLGTFETEREAAIAYNKKAKELFGEFACLNAISPKEVTQETDGIRFRNKEFKMKLLLTLALALLLTGCTQVILTKDRLKINTFLKSAEFDTAYYDRDPNGFFEINKYKGIPSDIELEYDPLTNSFKIKTKGK